MCERIGSPALAALARILPLPVHACASCVLAVSRPVAFLPRSSTAFPPALPSPSPCVKRPNPRQVDLYLQLGALLERSDPSAAIALYLSFPPPADGAPPGFNDAVVANCAVRLILDARDWECPQLVSSLITVGRVLGVLNIEKHIQTLDQYNQVDVIKASYLGILPPSVDQSAFFKHKGWDYERGR